MQNVVERIVATMLIFLMFPVLLLIAGIIWGNMGRPIFFRQNRPGLHGKVFKMYKFRTMTGCGDGDSDALRLTRLGGFLRKFSLDELPELINIVKGEMSFVGPRPLLVEYLTLYSEEQHKRHDVKPGITGWAQVNGRNNLDWDKKLKLDVWYVENRNIMLDLKILFLTISAIFKTGDVNKSGCATTDKFVGAKRQQVEKNNSIEKS